VAGKATSATDKVATPAGKAGETADKAGETADKAVNVAGKATSATDKVATGELGAASGWHVRLGVLRRSNAAEIVRLDRDAGWRCQRARLEAFRRAVCEEGRLLRRREKRVQTVAEGAAAPHRQAANEDVRHYSVEWAPSHRASSCLVCDGPAGEALVGDGTDAGQESRRQRREAMDNFCDLRLLWQPRKVRKPRKARVRCASQERYSGVVGGSRCDGASGAQGATQQFPLPGSGVRRRRVAMASASKKMAWDAEWWRRLDAHCVGALKALRGAADEVVGGTDECVSRWYLCRYSGLQARWAGRSRVKASRVSPGAGVCRKRRAAHAVPVRAAEAEQGLGEQSSELRAQRRSRTLDRQPCIRDGDARWVDSGNRLGRYRNKCLQRAVLDSVPSMVRTRLRSIFVHRCGNDEPCGLSGGAREARNFDVVAGALDREGLYMWVLSSRRRFKWTLGSVRGRCCGVLEWSGDLGHVRRLVGDSANVLAKLTPLGLPERAPWLFRAAGAPKKASKRGQHLRGVGNAIVTRGSSGVPGDGTAVGSDGLVATSGEPAEIAGGSAGRCDALAPVRAVRVASDAESSSGSAVGFVGRVPSHASESPAASLASSSSGLVFAGALPADLEADGGLSESGGELEVAGQSALAGGVSFQGSKKKRGAWKARRGDEDLEKESRLYQPELVDKECCQALLFNEGRGRLQCSHKPAASSDVCGVHRFPRHGRVRGAIPADKLEEFRRAALRPEKPSSKYYARHLMWHFASQVRSDVDSLGDLTGAEYEQCLQKLHKHVQMHRMQQKFERGAGVRDANDRGSAGLSKYGSERERYNGKRGGERFRWYSRGVFNKFLARMGVTESTCSERQCMLALAATSDELRKYPMVTERLVPCAGPQCYPHLDKRSSAYRLDVDARSSHDGVGGGGGGRYRTCSG
jgi:hypothetical protein